MSRHSLLRLLGNTLERTLDSFSVAKSAGTVVGSISPSGALRGGTDTESKLSIDHGMLRIQSLTTPGWNRAGVSYPGRSRVAGLAFVARILDGDIQSNPDGTAQHLAVGWFSSANPTAPLTDGNAIIFAENSTNAGKIQRNGPSLLQFVATFKGIEVYLVFILRATGCAYYIGSITGATDIPAYPNVRLIGVDAFKTDATVYPGIWQRALTSGTNNDTRAEAVDVRQTTYTSWYGTAHAADTLTSGSGTISGRTADGMGGTWTQQSGTLSITNGSGASGTTAGSNFATLDPGTTSGYIRLVVVTGASTPDVKLLFRWSDSQNYWDLQADGSTIRIEKRVANAYTLVASTGVSKLTTNSTHVLEVVDNGTDLQFYFTNVTAGTQAQVTGVATFTDTAIASNTKVGIGQSGNTANTFITSFEAHPRTVSLITLGLDLGALYETQGATSVYTDDFTGAAATALAGKATTTGSGTWTRLTGTKTITLNGSGVGVTSSGGTDTLYTLPWSSTAYADLSVDVTPPGASYGSGANGHSGVVFAQDANNYLAIRIYVNDAQTNAAELEAVLVLGGSGTVIKRINYGTVINHGITTTIRAVFDSDRFTVWRGTEAALMSALTNISSVYAALTINYVGLYTPGIDTGSSLDNFAAKSA